VGGGRGGGDDAASPEGVGGYFSLIFILFYQICEKGNIFECLRKFQDVQSTLHCEYLYFYIQISSQCTHTRAFAYHK
jgi:hypothetical protein